MRAGVPPSPEEVREQAEAVLARPEFDQAEPSPIDRAIEWIGERLGDLLGRGNEAAAGSRVFGYLVLAAGVAVCGYLLYRWLGRLRAETEPVDPAVVTGDPTSRPSDWRAAAERLEARGEWKEALRCRYRVLVSELVERELVDDVPGRTAGEYRAEVGAGLPAVAPAFSEASDLFELAWYADAPTGAEENRRIRGLTDQVLEGVG
jgi:hypothetical protein